jgi:transposase-like protein
VGRRIFDDVAASWKVLVDNFMECHHYATTHHELTDVLPEVATVIREEPISHRYSPEATAAAVRTVRALRTELGIGQGTVSRVARQLGHGVESVRYWVRQADIGDGYAPGVSSAESARIKEVEQENRELKRANVILKQAGSFFGPELDRQHKK